MKVVTGPAPQPGETHLPDTSPGVSPWASDGPDGAWWRGDPAAAAARFAAVRPIEPIPPAPTVTLAAPVPAEPAGGSHTLPETLPEPAVAAAEPAIAVGSATEPVEVGPAVVQPAAVDHEPAADQEPADQEPVTDQEPAAGQEAVTGQGAITGQGAVAGPPVAAEPELEPVPVEVEAEQPVTEDAPALAEAAAADGGDAEPDPEALPPHNAPGDIEAVTQPLAVRAERERETVRIAVPEPDERPFWMPVQEMPRGSRRPPVRGRPGRPPKPPRRPATGLIALLVFALLATFFAWVSAEPLWLAVGHGDKGTATVTECTGNGVSQRCLGEFTAAGGAFTAERVRLLGVGDQDGAGTTVAAKMVGSDSGRAYVDAASGVLHMRWGLGMALVVLCGLGIVWATGALRLEDSRSRRRAALAGLAAPLLVAIAFLAATF